MAEVELSESAKAELEAGKAARAESMKQFAERTKGRPTPTQEENDEAAVQLGKFTGGEHSADGSDPDPSGQVSRHLEGRPGGGYATRSHTASPSSHTETTRSSGTSTKTVS